MSPGLASFEPTALRRAVRQVREEHTMLSSQHPTLHSNLINEVKAKILSATSDAELKALASTLSPIELRAVLHLLAHETDSSTGARLETVALERPRSDLLRQAWALLRDLYPRDPLENVVRLWGDQLSWRGTARNEEQRARFARWFSTARLDEGLLRDYVRSDEQKLNRWLSEVGLEPRSQLHQAVWNSALLYGSPELLLRIGGNALRFRAEQSSDETQRRFGEHYLVAFEGQEDDWEDCVLEWIRGRFSTPSRNPAALSRFWRGVPTQTHERFRRWAVRLTLREFFESIKDPHGRFRFWNGFIRHIEDAEKFLGGTVAMLDFGSFGVVEFAEKGNAAYCYPREHFRSLWSTAERATDEGDFKDRYATLSRLPRDAQFPVLFQDGRIIHGEGWQERYAPYVGALTSARGPET